MRHHGTIAPLVVVLLAGAALTGCTGRPTPRGAPTVPTAAPAAPDHSAPNSTACGGATSTEATAASQWLGAPLASVTWDDESTLTAAIPGCEYATAGGRSVAIHLIDGTACAVSGKDSSGGHYTDSGDGRASYRKCLGERRAIEFDFTFASGEHAADFLTTDSVESGAGPIAADALFIQTVLRVGGVSD